MEGVLLHPPGAEAPGHDGAGVGFVAGVHGQQGGHGLGGGGLGLAAEGHEHRRGADGAVEALPQTPLEAQVQVGAQLPQAGAGEGQAQLRRGDHHGGVLVGAVGGEELSGQVGDDGAVPVHDHPGGLGDGGHHVGLQVLGAGGGDEGVHVAFGHHHGHALLALGDGQLRAVQAVVLFAHGV